MTESRKLIGIRPDDRSDIKYHPVDVVWLREHGLQVIRDLFERDGNRFRPVPSSGFVQTLDEAGKEELRKLLAHAQEEMDSARVTLEMLGEHGKKVAAELLTTLDIPELIEQVARGNMHDAQNAVTGILAVLTGGACRFAELLKQISLEKDATRSALDASETTIKEAGEISLDLYFEWADAAIAMITAVERLREIERSLRMQREELLSTVRTWDHLEDAGPHFVTAMADLDQFITFALEHKCTPVAPEELTRRIAAVRAVIASCEGEETKASARWLGLQKTIREHVTPHLTGITGHCDTLAEKTHVFRGWEKRYRPGMQRPHEAKDTRELISAEQYGEAQAILQSNEWAPETCKTRLHGLVRACEDVVGRQRPELPDRVQGLIARARKHLLAIDPDVPSAMQTYLATKGGSGAGAPAHDADDEDTQLVRRPQQQPTAPVQALRLEELYELITCVAKVVTHKQGHLSQTNIVAMLETLVILQRCTAEEVTQYKDAVKERSSAPGERETVLASGLVRDRMQTSDAHWLVLPKTRQGQREQLRLPLQMASVARQLMAKHGLDEEAIDRAHKQRRLQKNEERDARLRAKVTNDQDP